MLTDGKHRGDVEQPVLVHPHDCGKCTKISLHLLAHVGLLYLDCDPLFRPIIGFEPCTMHLGDACARCGLHLCSRHRSSIERTGRGAMVVVFGQAGRGWAPPRTSRRQRCAGRSHDRDRARRHRALSSPHHRRARGPRLALFHCSRGVLTRMAFYLRQQWPKVYSTPRALSADSLVGAHAFISSPFAASRSHPLRAQL